MKWERERKRKRVHYVDHFEQESPTKREARIRKQSERKWNHEAKR